MNKNGILFWIITGLVASIYLFVTAPVPLDAKSESEAKIPIKYVFEILNKENNIVRELYTKEIVLAGKKTGLKFDEHWKNKDIFAGPLPAQFLRQTALSLEKSKVPLGLYLGSDFPINKINLFEGKQANVFKTIKKTVEPQFFYVEDIKRFTYMAADIAISKACVSCHNKHKDSVKLDWKINDIMGATTWTYPEKYVSYKQSIVMLLELRQGFKKTYQRYLEKVKTFSAIPEIGGQWPRNGFYLPDVNNFSAEIAKRTSSQTMNSLMDFGIKLDSTDSGVISN